MKNENHTEGLIGLDFLTKNNNGFKVTDNLHQRQEENKLIHEGIAFRITTIEGINKDKKTNVYLYDIKFSTGNHMRAQNMYGGYAQNRYRMPIMPVSFSNDIPMQYIYDFNSFEIYAESTLEKNVVTSKIHNLLSNLNFSDTLPSTHKLINLLNDIKKFDIIIYMRINGNIIGTHPAGHGSKTDIKIELTNAANKDSLIISFNNQNHISLPDVDFKLFEALELGNNLTLDKDSVYDIHDIMERKNSLNTFMSILESNQFDVYNLNVLFNSMRLSIEKENGDLTGKS